MGLLSPLTPGVTHVCAMALSPSRISVHRWSIYYFSLSAIRNKPLRGIREDCLLRGRTPSWQDNFPQPRTLTPEHCSCTELMASDAALNKGRLSSRPVGYVMSDNCDERKTNYNENRKFQSVLPTWQASVHGVTRIYCLQQGPCDFQKSSCETHKTINEQLEAGQGVSIWLVGSPLSTVSLAWDSHKVHVSRGKIQGCKRGHSTAWVPNRQGIY